MKKITICAVALLGSSMLTNAQSFNLIKQGGGPNGYSRVEQTTDANGNTDMSCTSPGNDKCVAVNPPSSSPSTPKAADVNGMIGIVDNLIKDGSLSGQATYNGYEGTWSGSNVYNYTLSIEAL